MMTQSNRQGRAPIYPGETMGDPCSLRAPASLWRRYGEFARQLGTSRSALIRAHMEADLDRQRPLPLDPSPNPEHTSPVASE